MARRQLEDAVWGQRVPEGAGGGLMGRVAGMRWDRIGLGVLEVLGRGTKQYKIELIALSIYF